MLGCQGVRVEVAPAPLKPVCALVAVLSDGVDGGAAHRPAGFSVAAHGEERHLVRVRVRA